MKSLAHGHTAVPQTGGILSVSSLPAEVRRNLVGGLLGTLHPFLGSSSPRYPVLESSRPGTCPKGGDTRRRTGRAGATGLQPGLRAATAGSWGRGATTR